MATFFGQEQTPEQQAAWDAARAVFNQFAAAEAYVFNIPMWNHGIPYPLKQWIDIITQPGWAFGFDPSQGYSGLMQGKRAFVVYTSGVYADGRPASFGTDFATTYFDDWLSFVGITDVESIRLLGQVLDPDAAGAVAAATERASELGLRS
jgi:FMN-dependent NADH-azoreductase